MAEHRNTCTPMHPRLFNALSALYKQAALVVFMRKIRDLEKNIVMPEHWAVSFIVLSCRKRSDVY